MKKTEKLLILKDKIKESKKILLLGHKKPDGDCIGSINSLYYLFKNLGKEVKIYLNQIPEFFKNFLSDNKNIIFEISKEYAKTFDLIFILDTSSIDFLEFQDFDEYFKDIYTVVIDHHLTNKGYKDLYLVDKKASSCCENLYNIIFKLNFEIDINMAKSLLLGIYFDTGNFKYQNVTYKTFKIASKLLKIAKDLTFFNKLNYEKKDINTYSHLKEMLASFREYKINGYKFLFSISKKEDRDNNNFEDDKVFSTGIYDIFRNIDSDVTILLLEKKESVHVEFRSKNLDVSLIANNFGGGGHKLASGFESKDHFENIIDQILNYFNTQI
jgi:phosphoesterase RecJ-like protein